MPFAPVGAFDLVALERRVLSRWDDHDVFGESLRRREGAPEWVFYEGPPTANGRPGIHHVWARLFKDLYPRFHTMRGRYVARKGGWDCHGLPVEVEVEKELGFSGKHDIEEYGIEAFNARCRESVHRYVADFADLTRRIGMWIDTDDAYWTLSNDYIESVWWHFRRLWDDGHIYEGYKVVPYCARCGTALSSHELGQSEAYREITEPSIYVRFPVDERDFDLLVWTTTPWTLISNTGVAINPAIDYVRVRRSAPGKVSRTNEGRDLIIAADRLGEVLGDQYEVVSRVAADELVGLRYERPFDLLPLDETGEASVRVVAADFVTTEDGSGIVHLAPAFGEVDREISEQEDLALLNPVDAAGHFESSVSPYAGDFVKDADPAIIDHLAEAGKLERVIDYTHSYPHCWRCGTPLIYWAKPTWFAGTSAEKPALLRENEAIGWHPEHIKHGRFGDWLENNVDWALSRDRFWGTPMPVWRCTECRADTCVGSVAELSELAGRDLAELDLHRPFVDEVVVRCSDCGGEARRVEPVLDAWFDSGAMPAAQFHYPLEHEELFERRFPADFICEAIDQTRGWFYSLLAVNTLVFGRSPYRNVVSLALVVDRNGQKMSKSRGNVIDPWSILDTRGADALRWYFFSAGSPWTPRRVYEDGIDESTRRFLLTLWNTYSFFVTYANLDGYEPSDHASAPTHVLDRWVRSRLHRSVREVTEALDEFDSLRAAKAIERLIDDVSNWYVRRSRPRFWKTADREDSSSAHATLHECLVTVALILAPFTPFVAEELFGNLSPARKDDGAAGSVHLADWPEPDLDAIDDELEEQMVLARRLVSLGRAAREEARMKVRQPLSRALVLADAPLPAEIVAEVANELNVRVVERVTTLEGLLDYSVTPNFAALGPKLGSMLPRVKEILASLDGSEARRTLDERGVLRLDVDGETIDLGPGDVEIRAQQHEELALAQEGPYAVALDLTLNDDLRAEGLARELARVLNEARKAAGFEIADRIEVTLQSDGAVANAARRFGDWIADEVLAERWEVVDYRPVGARELRVDGVGVWARIERC